MYRFKITIDKTKVTGTNTNFVYLFSEGCSGIPSGFWSHVSDTTNGLDIRFFDTDGVTELKREVVLYSAGTQKVEAWVQIPSLGTSANREIWCQYGGATVVSSTGVWNEINGCVVLHFQNLNDSSPNGYNASNSGADPVTGKVENAYSFVNANSNYMTVPSSGAINYSNGVSVSFWMNLTTFPAAYRSLVASYPQAGNGFTFDMHPNDGGKWFYFYVKKSGSSATANDAVTTLSTGIWYHVIGTYDPITGYAKIYLNGELKATSSQVTGIDVSSANLINLGRRPDASSGYLDGILDNVCVYNTPLNAEWIATEYANQNAPSTFSTSSTEEDVSNVYRFPITIDKTKVYGTHTNFVYMFSESIIGIPGGFWSRVKDASGLDIRFYDSENLSELKREIVLFDSVNKKVEAWVQIPSLLSVHDKTIWCMYGGDTAVNSTAVWTDINGTSIYHGQNVFNDSAGSANGVVTGMTQVDGGKTHKGYQSTGSGNNVTVTKTMHSGTFTVAIWVYMTGDNSTDRCVLIDQTGISYGIILRNSGAFSGDNQLNGTTGWAVYQYQGGLGWAGAISGDTYDSQKNAWHRVVGTYDGNKNFRMYVDGVLKNTYNIGAYSLPAASSANLIGCYNSSAYSMIGTIDELDFFTDAKSDDWIATEYANQNDPATFSRCGVESNSGETSTVIMVL